MIINIICYMHRVLNRKIHLDSVFHHLSLAIKGKFHIVCFYPPFPKQNKRHKRPCLKDCPSVVEPLGNEKHSSNSCFFLLSLPPRSIFSKGHGQGSKHWKTQTSCFRSLYIRRIHNQSSAIGDEGRHCRL